MTDRWLTRWRGEHWTMRYGDFERDVKAAWKRRYAELVSGGYL